MTWLDDLLWLFTAWAGVVYLFAITKALERIGQSLELSNRIAIRYEERLQVEREAELELEEIRARRRSE